MADPAPLVTIKVDGKAVGVPKGTNLLQALLDAGTFVPHFCYHPALTPVGNCRMCLVAVKPGPPKPVSSCTTPVSEGMEVFTGTPDVKEARKGVLEFLLINHPLDCPVCDCAGECLLQDFAFRHGPGRSRFVEEKVLRPVKDLGPLVKLWGTRCIACTRCVRFCDEIAGTGELTMSERGDHACVDVAPGVALDNPLSGNVVDLCPVGALINRDFLYQSRVWFLRRTPSVCALCSTGCSIFADVDRRGVVKRFVPRRNAAVNGHWMCDEGRRSSSWASGERRARDACGGFLGSPAGASEALDRFWEHVRERSAGEGSRIAALVSLWHPTEEILLFRELFGDGLGATVGVIERPPGSAWKARSGFEIRADKNPNRRGAELVLGKGVVAAGWRPAIDAVASGRAKVLVVLDDVLGGEPPAELGRAVGEAESSGAALLAVVSVSRTRLWEHAAIRRCHGAGVGLPGRSFLEKEGTFMNATGRIQRLQPAILPPAGMSELEILRAGFAAFGKAAPASSPGALFRRWTEAAGMPGLDLARIPAEGLDLGAGAPPPPRPLDLPVKGGRVPLEGALQNRPGFVPLPA